MVGRPVPWRDTANFIGDVEKGADEWFRNTFNFPQPPASISAGPIESLRAFITTRIKK